MPVQRHLQLIALAWLVPGAARAAEPLIEDRTLANGVRVVLAPAAEAPIEVRGFGGGCEPCRAEGVGSAELARLAERIGEPRPPAPEEPRERARRELRALALGRARGRALVVIAGGFELTAVRAAVEERFAGLPAPPPTKERKELERVARVPSDRARLLVGLAARAGSPGEAWAVAIAERLLFTRMDRRIPGQVATAVEWLPGAQLVRVEVEPADGGAAALVRETLDDELGRLSREPIAPRELEAARKALTAPASRAARLAELTLTCGNPRLEREAAADLARVSAADVQRAAARLADRAHRSTVETYAAAAALPAERRAPKVP